MDSKQTSGRGKTEKELRRESDASIKGSQEMWESMSAYQPIDTAPKNGEWLLLLSLGYTPLVGRWLLPTPYQKDVDGFEGCWLGEQSDSLSDHKNYRDGITTYEPTHWMPLPKEPDDE